MAHSSNRRGCDFCDVVELGLNVGSDFADCGDLGFIFGLGLQISG